MPRCDVAELRGGIPAENAAAGARFSPAQTAGAQRDPAQRRRCHRGPGHAQDLREGLEVARETVDSGAQRSGWSSSPRSRADCRHLMGRFRDALAAPGLGAIAEVKRRSPSAGELGRDADPARLAAQFANAGAAAIWIFVDDRFGGSLDDLKAARAATTAPLLAKGFFTEELDLLKLKLAGADAALVILRDVDDQRAAGLISYGKSSASRASSRRMTRTRSTAP